MLILSLIFFSQTVLVQVIDCRISLNSFTALVSCITLHEGFAEVCLSKYALWTELVYSNQHEGAWLPDENSIPNR